LDIPFREGQEFPPIEEEECFVAKEDTPNTPPALDPNPEPAAQTPPAAQQRVQIEIDDSKVAALYANFCRVTGTPEELIIDFGLNPQPMVGTPTHPLPVQQRMVTNYFTAKRLLHALNLTIQRHEAMFGVLETDVQKRVRMSPTGQAR
jgi:hypothetical protein